MTLFSAETLRQQGAGMRGLARDLLSDGHAAEDVAQDAWLQAIRRRVSPGEGLGAWLRKVTRSRAAMRRREGVRRERRERAVAVPESLDPVDVGVAHREVLRQVVDAVLGLREPFRSTVILRYWHDLAPSAIAERSGVGVATVDSRLHRARGMLRERLDAAAGGDRQAWAPALAVLLGDRVGPVAVPGLVGAAKMSMVIVAGVVLGTWWAGQDEKGGGDATAPGRGATTGQETRSEIVAERREAESGLLRGRIVDWVDPVPSLPHEYELALEVVDAEDLPMRGVSVWVAPEEGVFNEVGSTNEQGRCTLRFRSQRPDAVLWVMARASFLEPSFRRLSLRAGAVCRARLPVERAGRRGPEERPAFGPDPLVAERSEDGWSCFVAPSRESIRTMAVDEFEGTASMITEEILTLQGRVLDVSGSPVAGTLVSVASESWSDRGRSDEEGRFELEVLRGALYEITAGGGAIGRGRGVVDLRESDAGLTTSVITVETGRVVEGRVAEPGEGEWLVELSGGTVEQPWVDLFGPLPADGRFRIPQCVEGPISVLLRRPGLPFVFDRRPLRELPLQPSTGSRFLELVATDAGGRRQDEVELRLWQEGCDAATWMRPTEEGHRIDGLPPGRYSLALLDHDLGVSRVRDIDLRAGEGRSLGELRLPRPARLAVEVREDEGSVHHLDLWRHVHGIPCLVAEELPATGFALAVSAGDYAVRVHGPRGVLLERRLSLDPGQESSVVLDLRELRRVRIGLAPDLSERAELSLRTAAGRDVLEVSVDAHSLFETMLAPGDYVLSAESPEGSFRREIAVVEGGELQLGAADRVLVARDLDPSRD